MRLVVIDAHRTNYRVYQDREFIAEYHSPSGEPATAEQIEEIRLAEPPKPEQAA